MNSDDHWLGIEYVCVCVFLNKKTILNKNLDSHPRW